MDPVQPAETSVPAPSVSDSHPVYSLPPTPTPRATTDLERRLRAEDPARIVLVADCDMTLAEKPQDNFHFLSLRPEQTKTLRRASKSFALSVVLTARGEQSTLDILKDGKGALPGLVLASNCGHHVLADTAAAHIEERYHHPIGAMTLEESALLRDIIHGLLETIRQDYVAHSGRLIIDPRELCGAIIWEGMELDDAKALTKLAQHEMGLLPDGIKTHLHYDSKHVEINGTHYGYMDFKPHGMDKGSSLHALFGHSVITARMPENPLLIVAGDSWPDYAMMQAAVERFGPENVINICVGDDPSFRCIGDDNTKMTDVDIHRISGDQYTAIPQFYALLEQAIRPAMRSAPR